MIVKKLVLANPAITRKIIVMPDGRELVLGINGLKSFVIDNEKDMLFLSKQRDISIIDLNADETKAYIEKLPKIPTVDKTLSKEEAAEFDPAQLDEEKLKDILIKKGYDVFKVGLSDEVSNAISRLSDTSLVQEIVRRCKMNPELEKAIGIELVPTESIKIEDMGFDQLKQYLAKLGYIGLRKKEGE